MNHNDDDIHYKYKPDSYQPGPGNSETDTRSRTNTNTIGYHSETDLRELLTKIKEVTDATVQQSEVQLQRFSLEVPADSPLQKAQTQEWPSSLGTAKQYVHYEQYKALERKQTRGSELIRQSYEDNVRGPFGTTAIDTLIVSKAIKQEAVNVEKFLDTYLGDVDDTSEYRILELLQDWANSGLQKAKTVGQILVSRIKNEVQIPTAEVDKISETTARSYQALFQTKVNAVNKDIKQLTEDLNKEHNMMSEIFYNKFLGPALNFRLKVSRNLEMEQYSPSILATQAGEADRAMAADLNNLITDQMKRNENFDIATDNLIVRLRYRDGFAAFTQQMNSITQGEATTPFVAVDLSEDEIETFKEMQTTIESQADDEDIYTSAHAMLDGVDLDDAHSQYFLKSGDLLVGDLELEAGVRIDGIIPSTHAHTGLDGSVKIKGSDIEGGTLSVDAVDTGELPTIPTDLKLESFTNKTVPPGFNVIDALISWTGDDTLTYEVQISRPGSGA